MGELFFSIAHIADKIVIGVLVLFSFLVLGISLERYFFLKPIHRKSLQAMRKIREILRSGKLNEVEELAQDTTYPAGQAIASAMTHIKKNGSSGLAELFKTFYLQEKPIMEGSISILATIGSNAPFIGLLGTVFGIMRAFHDLGTALQEVGQQTVMAGISVALLATALGLAVAIPSVMLYNYFRRKIDRTLDTLNNVGELCMAYSLSVSNGKNKGQKATSQAG